MEIESRVMEEINRLYTHQKWLNKIGSDAFIMTNTSRLREYPINRQVVLTDWLRERRNWWHMLVDFAHTHDFIWLPEEGLWVEYYELVKREDSGGCGLTPTLLLEIDNGLIFVKDPETCHWLKTYSYKVEKYCFEA